MKKELTIQEQIDVLIETKKKLTGFGYVCVIAWNIVREKLNITNDEFLSEKVRDYIPLLTFENAEIACKNANYQMPIKRNNGGWWLTQVYSVNNMPSRIAFIDFVIEELTKKLTKEISIQEQIDILKSVVDKVKHRHYSFVCVNIWNMLRDKGFGTELSWFDSHNATTYIPLLTIENAKIACKKAHVTMPKIQYNNAWWDRGNVKSRIAFINWMIKELESKL